MSKSDKIFYTASVIVVGLGIVVAVYSQAIAPKPPEKSNEMMCDVQVLSIDWGAAFNSTSSAYQEVPVHFKRLDNGEVFSVFIPRWQLTIWSGERCKIHLKFNDSTELLSSKELEPVSKETKTLRIK